MSKRWKALVFAVIPGLGHLYLGRHWRALLAFTLFAIGANGMSACQALPDRVMAIYVFHLCLTASVAAWIYSVLSVYSISRGFRAKPVGERRDYHFKRGLTQYLAGSFDGAKAELLTVLKLDPMDVDARFHLGMTLKALGDWRGAAKAFKRCLADDLDAKWQWEIETALAELKQAR